MPPRARKELRKGWGKKRHPREMLNPDSATLLAALRSGLGDTLAKRTGPLQGTLLPGS